MKRHIYVPCRLRTDLLVQSLCSLGPLWRETTVINNTCSTLPIGPEWHVHTLGEWPWPAAQMANWMMADAQRRDLDYYFWMHDDNAFLDASGPTDFLNAAEHIFADDKTVGVIRTHDYTGVAHRITSDLATGFYDGTWPDYFCDTDYYYRVQLAGFKVVDLDILRGRWVHHGSQTLNSDPLYKLRTDVFWPSYVAWYKAKWGGCPLVGTPQQFSKPFNGRFC